MLHAQQDDAVQLLERHAQLREQLATNAFKRPLVLESSDRAGQLRGEVYALLEQPFSLAAPRLMSMAQWCDVLILHLNVKSCRPSPAGVPKALKISIGRKSEQPLADAYPFKFLYQVKVSRPDYLQVQLSAEDGPLGTNDYLIGVELVAVDEQRSFVRLSYAYRYGMAAEMAMQGYLTTIGRDKVGFSVIGKDSHGQPIYQGRMLGLVERNTMRYYLALEAYLGAFSGTAAQQQEQRLNDWYTAVEGYPLQLHELQRGEYLAMKHIEIRRQQKPLASASAP
jgi:hypothetical protein